jgi:hypothetical protein
MRDMTLLVYLVDKVMQILTISFHVRLDRFRRSQTRERGHNPSIYQSGSLRSFVFNGLNIIMPVVASRVNLSVRKLNI